MLWLVVVIDIVVNAVAIDVVTAVASASVAAVDFAAAPTSLYGPILTTAKSTAPSEVD